MPEERPTNQDVLKWVKDPDRTVKELAEACYDLEIGNVGHKEELRGKLIRYLRRQGLYKTAEWIPPEWREEEPRRFVRVSDEEEYDEEMPRRRRIREEVREEPRRRKVVREEVHETRRRENNGGNGGNHDHDGHDHDDHDHEAHVEHHDRYSDMVTWGLAIAALLGTIAIAVWLWTNPAEKVDLGPVEKKLGDINVAVTNLVTDVTTLSTTIQATNESVTKLRTDLDDTNKNLGDLDKKLEARSTETDRKINEGLEGLESKIDEKIDRVNGRIDDLRIGGNNGTDGGSGSGSESGTGGNNGGTGTGASWTPAQKGEWLRANFPQTTEAVQALGARLAGVPTQRVRTHLYPVDSVNTVFDGFIILGPNEGFQGEVTLEVPPNGAVDAYPGARFTGRTKRIGSETTRALDGTVTGVSMTYWPWLDEDPPIGQKTQTATDNTKTDAKTAETPKTNVEGPEQLATRMGWKVIEWADQKYGGLRVELSSPGQLPDKWEALASGRTIKESDTNREMVPGVWTIYPPFADREALGFSK